MSLEYSSCFPQKQSHSDDASESIFKIEDFFNFEKSFSQFVLVAEKERNVLLSNFIIAQCIS